jgi:hypothetical protein
MVMISLNMVLVGFYMAGSARAESISLIPSLRLGERWDSNPFLRGEGEEVNHDFLTELSPQITVRSITRGVRVSGSYRLDSRHYARYRQLDFISHNANIAVNAEISKTSSLSIGDSFRFTPDSLEATDIGVQTRRTDILSNTLFVLMEHDFSRAASASLRLTDSILEFEGEGLVDTRTDSAELSGIYSLRTDTRITISYGFTNYHFNVPDGDNDIESQSLRLAMNRQFSPAVSASVSAGAVYTPDVDNDLDWTARAGFMAAYRLSSYSLDYSRSITNSSGLADEINVRDSASMRLNYIFSRFFNTTLSGSLSKNRSEPSGRLDTTSYTAVIACVWRPYSRLSFDANYSHFQQWAEGVLGENLKRDQVFIGITATMDEVRF